MTDVLDNLEDALEQAQYSRSRELIREAMQLELLGRPDDV